MKFFKIIFLALLTILSSCTKSEKDHSDQIKINYKLKNKLENILLKDQGIREIVNGNVTEERKTELLTEMSLKESDIDGNKK